jgi:acetylornithine deacetylase/succinyl-diaminopimelate desuccinylase-like protein
VDGKVKTNANIEGNRCLCEVLHCRKRNNSSEDGQSNHAEDFQGTAKEYKQSLMARWRFPTLSIHKVDVSLNDSTIIPGAVSAAVSIRIVPDQEIGDIISRFEDYVQKMFATLDTDNKIEVLGASLAKT